MEIKLFTSDSCPVCPVAKKALISLVDIINYSSDQSCKLIIYNVDNVKGLAESSKYEIGSTPSIVVSPAYDTKDEFEVIMGLIDILTFKNNCLKDLI